MRHYEKLLVILVAFVSMNAWADLKTPQEISSEAKSRVTHVSVDQLTSDLSSNENFTLIDIRTEAEFEAGHIRGAKWLPRGKLDFQIQDLVSDPGSRIVLYCGSGGRSALAAISLQDIGYENVVDLDGGFKQWIAEDQPIYNMYGELKVLDSGKEE